MIKNLWSHLSLAGVDAPLTQSFFSYMLLALVYGPILLGRRQTLLVTIATQMMNFGRLPMVHVWITGFFLIFADTVVLVPPVGPYRCRRKLS
jgi:hypothetical protein